MIEITLNWFRSNEDGAELFSMIVPMRELEMLERF